MTTKQWLVRTLTLIGGCVALFATFNYTVDPYCLFHCRPDRLIPVYTNERTTKYLFGFGYIPTSFDGVLVGSSISGNWNTAKIGGFKVYNTSLSGGNAAESELILDHVFDRGKIRLAIFIVHPAMVDGHEPRSASMNPQEYWGSLGSVPLLQSYAARMLGSMGLHRNECDAFGVYDITDLLTEAAKTQKQAVPKAVQAELNNPGPARPYVVDKVAVAQYRHLIDRARANGAVIVAVIPPRLEYAGFPRKPDETGKRLLAEFLPQDIVVDLDSSSFNAIRQNPENFWDGLHLTNEAANMAIEAINRNLVESKARINP